MRVVVCREFGSPDCLRIEDWPCPVPGPGQVLVGMHAAGINYTDVLAVAGRSQLQRSFPLVPGIEGAGVILETGAGVTRRRPGERVFASCLSGAFAQAALFEEDEVYPVPDAMDMRTAAVFYIASMTAHYAIFDRARLAAGELLLVLGAGSGAGLAAVQIGKACGARVVAAASSSEKLALATAAGADAVLRYPLGPLDVDAQKKLTRELLALAPRSGGDAPDIGRISTLRDDRGFHVVFDGVGGSFAEPVLRALGWHGRYLSVGFAAGMPKVALGPILFKDGAILGIQPAAQDRPRTRRSWPNRSGASSPQSTGCGSLRRRIGVRSVARWVGCFAVRGCTVPI